MMKCGKKYKKLVGMSTTNKGIKVWESKIPKQIEKTCGKCKKNGKK